MGASLDVSGKAKGPDTHVHHSVHACHHSSAPASLRLGCHDLAPLASQLGAVVLRRHERTRVACPDDAAHLIRTADHRVATGDAAARI